AERQAEADKELAEIKAEEDRKAAEAAEAGRGTGSIGAPIEKEFYPDSENADVIQSEAPITGQAGYAGNRERTITPESFPDAQKAVAKVSAAESIKKIITALDIFGCEKCKGGTVMKVAKNELKKYV
ncbi:unnamed protein product, partial [marine sediment metagenome]